MCMGRGVVVRREAWQKVGGYPEIVQEDTAFTMRLRQHGYDGLFATEVISREEFPEDFKRFCRLSFVWCRPMPKSCLHRCPSFGRQKVSLLWRR